METKAWTARIILSKAPSSKNYLIDYVGWYDDDGDYCFETKSEEIEATDLIREAVKKYQ